MAIVIGHPGSSARKTWFIDRYLLPLTLLIFAVLVSPFAAYAFGRSNPIVMTFVFVVTTGVCLYIWRDDYLEMYTAFRASSNWAKGADGEAAAGAVLATLSDDYIVFHDFNPTQAGVVVDWNVDHIVIGPNGMFVVETKNYSAKRVQPASKSGFARKNVQQTQRNAMTFKNKIKSWSAGGLGDVFVVPLLVYAQVGAFVEKTREDGVHVIPLKWLAGEVTTHNARRQLNPDEIYRIANVMFHQMQPYLMDAYRAEFDRYGEFSCRFKLERASARSSASAQQAVAVTATAMSDVGMSVAAVAEAASVPTVCPECGGRLVERTAGKGPRAGKKFLGCSNFRSAGCKFGFNLEP